MWKVSGKDASADSGEWSLIVSASNLRAAQRKAREYCILASKVVMGDYVEMQLTIQDNTGNQQ